MVVGFTTTFAISAYDITTKLLIHVQTKRLKYIYTPIKYFLNIISSTNQLFQISIFIISLNITYIKYYYCHSITVLSFISLIF
jgi:hypothetical protein